jgi:hypothetical protein
MAVTYGPFDDLEFHVDAVYECATCDSPIVRVTPISKKIIQDLIGREMAKAELKSRERPCNPGFLLYFEQLKQAETELLSIDNYVASLHYSGENSHEFWNIINSLGKPERESAYSAGVDLQILEERTLKMILLFKQQKDGAEPHG